MLSMNYIHCIFLDQVLQLNWSTSTHAFGLLWCGAVKLLTHLVASYTVAFTKQAHLPAVSACGLRLAVWKQCLYLLISGVCES